MFSVEALSGFVITMFLANSVLQLIFIACWIWLVRPRMPVLKPVTLCATATSIGRRVLLLSRFARQLSFEILGHLSGREQIVLKTADERIQEYV